jgi:hypothetical protein
MIFCSIANVFKEKIEIARKKVTKNEGVNLFAM